MVFAQSRRLAIHTVTSLASLFQRLGARQRTASLRRAAGLPIPTLHSRSAVSAYCINDCVCLFALFSSKDPLVFCLQAETLYRLPKTILSLLFVSGLFSQKFSSRFLDMAPRATSYKVTSLTRSLTSLSVRSDAKQCSGVYTWPTLTLRFSSL